MGITMEEECDRFVLKKIFIDITNHIKYATSDDLFNAIIEARVKYFNKKLKCKAFTYNPERGIVTYRSPDTVKSVIYKLSNG